MFYQLYRSDSNDCWDTANDEMVLMAYSKILPQAAENHKKFSVRKTAFGPITRYPNLVKCTSSVTIAD
jgi:hypothetical protein